MRQEQDDKVPPGRLLEVTRAIAQWTRLSGTAEERAATGYVTGQLRAMGYATRILIHDAHISLPGKAALRVTRPHGREIPCITHSMGVATGPSGTTSTAGALPRVILRPWR